MKTLSQLLTSKALPKLYKNEWNVPIMNAQENLEGRTYHVDPTTLRCHKTRILSALPVSNGAFYKIIESTALDWDNKKRGFRAVLFDIFGNTVYRPDLDQCFTNKEKADKAFYAWFEEFNEFEHYREKIQMELAETKTQTKHLEEILGNFDSIPYTLTEKEITA